MSPAKIATDYQESFQFLQAKKKRQVAQLVLLNNLRRGDEFIGSTLLLTLFTRMLSALYDDKIQIKFLPSQGITQNQLNSFNILAQSDYQEMSKSKLDYDWCWDTLFFGRGYMETLRFDKKRKIMQPHVINPLAMGYDPYFSNPQDWRYYWKWITKNKWEIDALIKAGVITGVDKAEDLPSGIDPYLWEYKIIVDQARLAVPPPVETAAHDAFQILEYYGYNEQGKRCVYWTDKNASKIIMHSELDLEDGEDLIAPDGTVVDKGSRWPIVMKEAFRDPHSSTPFSVADLLEDKHRAKSVLLNLLYISAKDQANPLYWYDVDKIEDVAQFLSRQINQHIPVKGDGSTAVGPVNKSPGMTADQISFLTTLQQEANDPVGTGVSLEPSAGGQETATEVAVNQQLNDLAQSLTSKVMQFGETEFWSHWFARYKKHGPDLKSKIANVVGVKGVDSTKVNLMDFNTDFPPGIMVYSAKEAEYKNLVKKRDWANLYPQLAETLSPDGFRNFNKYIFFPLSIEDPSLIETIFPKTLDEIKAEDENAQLAVDQMPQVLPTDNHETHIYIHRQLMPKTNAAWFHMAEHEDLLAQQKQAIMQSQMMEQGMAPQGGPQFGAQATNSMEAAAPLKGATMTSNQQQ